MASRSGIRQASGVDWRCSRAVVLALAFCGVFACRDEQPKPSPPPTPLEIPEPPRDMLASVVIPAPQVVYEAWRSKAGDGSIMPRQFPVALTQLLGLPPLVSGRFQTHHAATMALALGDAKVGWVLGLRVASGAALIAELTTGSGARFSALEKGHVALLRGARTTFGVVDSTLLIASEERLLERYGLYVARRQMPDAKDVGRDHDAVLELMPGSGPRLKAWLESATDGFIVKAREAVAREAAKRAGAETLVDPEQLFGLLNGVANEAAKALRQIESGTATLSLKPDGVSLAGRFSTKPPAPTSARAAACDGWLRLGTGVMAAAVFPTRVLTHAQRAPNSDRAIAPDRRRAETDVAAFVAGFRSPILFAMGAQEQQPVFSLSGAWRAPKPSVGAGHGMLAFLGTDVMSAALGERSFPASPEPTARGVVTSKGGNAAWQLAWTSQSEATVWAVGAGADAWLEAGARVDVRHTFPGWSGLCEGEPLLAFGLKQGEGDLTLAVTRTARQVELDAQLPPDVVLALLPEKAEP